MKAAVLDGVNQPLVVRDVPTPQAGDNEVIVQVAAAALNHRDVWIQQGLYAGLKFPIILGSDGAGTVVDVGADVDRGWLGQAVTMNPGKDWGDNPRAQGRQYKILGLPEDGTFAEQVKVPAQNLVAKPAHLSFAAAAALPLGGLTAYRALFTRGNLQPGERVLITGVGGGVAMLAFQLAVAAGAQVYVTSGSDDKLARVQQLGAAGGVNYRADEWAKKLREQASGFDLIFDSAGGAGFPELIELANPGGRVVNIGATLGNPKSIDLRRVFWKQVSILGSTMGTAEDFAALIKFVNQHQLVPVIDMEFPLSEAEAAMQRMAAADQFGKIVLTI